jgi:hypothetical protein
MQQLGVMPKLQIAADGLPDARSRLNYIANKTAAAADKVLNSVDQAKAEHAAISRQTRDAGAALWPTRCGGGQRRGVELRADVERAPQRIDQHLTDIMLAQDFHDLTGQVVAKVVRWPTTWKTAWSSCWCRWCRPSSARRSTQRAARPGGRRRGPHRRGQQPGRGRRPAGQPGVLIRGRTTAGARGLNTPAFLPLIRLKPARRAGTMAGLLRGALFRHGRLRQDKQLPASQRKISKAREEGQVARSRDLGHFGAIGAGAACWSTWRSR